MGNITVQNTSASLSGKTLMKLEDSQTVTGQKTFDVGASSPYLVLPGSAKVDNLDADMVDGDHATDLHDAQQLTGVLPVTVIAADPNADSGVFWDDSAGAFKFFQFLGLAITAGNTLTLSKGIPCGRLTLTSALPITSSDVTAATTIYWALYQGNTIALYNGTFWENFLVSELSIAVPNAANTIYDVFVDYNSGTPILSLLAWSSDTARATVLVLQDGIAVLTGATTKRYVGTFRTTTVAGQTEDSTTKRYVWNYYNRVRRTLLKQESTATWDYNTATFRQARADATNQVEVVVGLQEVLMHLALRVDVTDATGVGSTSQAFAGIGEDSTTALAAGTVGTFIAASNYIQSNLISSELNKYPAIGKHVYAWIERGDGGGNTTRWSGFVAGAYANGLSGFIDG
jgi:hypothetical protein